MIAPDAGKVSNLNNLLASPVSAQRVASRVIASADSPFLATLGPNPLPIKSPLISSKKKLFTVNDMSMIQQDLGLSNKKVKRLAEDMRTASGSRTIIEKGMIEKVREKNRQLDSFFVAKRCTFTVVNEATKSKENFEQHITVCSDLNGLLNKIIDERQINEENMLVRIGMDGGGGFLKVCLSAFEFENEENNSEKRRIVERFKNSGVKKVFIIAAVPDVQENFYNVKRIWHEVGLDSLTRKFTIATDLKLCNILLGLMSHSSSHPCCWCDVRKGDLRSKGVSRTIQSLTDQFWSYFGANATKKDAKEFGNVIHTNVFARGHVDPSTLIILLVPPPELHLMMGPVNTMFDALSKNIGRDNRGVDETFEHQTRRISWRIFLWK